MIMEITLNEVYSLYIKPSVPRGFYRMSARDLMPFYEFIENELLNVVKRNYFSKVDEVKII